MEMSNRHRYKRSFYLIFFYRNRLKLKNKDKSIESLYQIIAIIIFIVVTILSLSNICYQFDKVYALLPIQKSSYLHLHSHLFLYFFELANTNSINSSSSSPSYPSIENFNIYPGYTIQSVIWNLTLPSSVAFDNENNMYIAEAGFVYGGLQPIPRILKVDSQSGNISILVDRKNSMGLLQISNFIMVNYMSHIEG